MPVNTFQLNQLIERKVSDTEVEFVKDFCEAIYEKAGPDFLEAFKEEALLELALSGLEFLRTRASGEILVRAYNPSLQTHGWESFHTAIELAMRDRPFIFDSMRAFIARKGMKLHHSLHPIIGLRRDEQGRMLPDKIDKAGRENAEAYELFLTDRVHEPKRLRQIESDARQVLSDVVLATDDYRAMQRKTEEVREHIFEIASRLHRIAATTDGEADLKEYAEFLGWLADGNFVFLGYREYHIVNHGGVRCMQVVPDSALGILRKLETSTYHEPVPMEEIPEDLRKRITTGPILLVTKSNSESTVHRPARMDYIGVKRFDESGQAAGEKRFLGLFTSKAHGAPVDRIPILRRKLTQVLALDKAIEGSHDFKQIVAIFNSMPREELFWSPTEQLYRDIRTIMALEQERGVRVTVRPDPLSRGLALMVIMPRENFNTGVRRKIQDLLAEKLEATHVDYHLAMGEDEAQIRFHFFFTTSVSYSELDLTSIDREVADLARSWEDQLAEGLRHRMESSLSSQLASRYARAFDEGYKAETPAAEAISDIDNLEALGESPYLVDLENPPQARYRRRASHLKIYHQKSSLVLSDVFPFLENLGLTVIEQISHPVSGKDEESSRGLDVFRVVDGSGRPLDPKSCKERLVEAMLEMLLGRADNDGLNHLILTADLRVHEVALLRTMRGYLAQLQAATSRSFITETLIRYPESARCIHRFFRAKFDPSVEGDRNALVASAAESFRASLDQVKSLSADNALRDLFNIAEATVRTNFPLRKSCISLKIRSADVRVMPEPRPLYEIVVTSPLMEGIHLRGGEVARGGLRWSDRPDDYRTEVLGLMKTQMTKNAVIVPVGSKGGFVVKRAPADRDRLPGHVTEQYRTFVRGLLDLTDNIVEGQVAHPPGVVLHDQPDPYLVVAADKGTATFSDVANSISEEYNFWLGDAFASGGSYGYDHKKEGITARGAWECVSRHFRELGVDVMKQEFSAVGIGDMSGDVFGNGMIYSDKIRLLAAFNHQHIFLDPKADAQRGCRERRRLFELPRSTWDDYDRSAISEGGGVFARQAKTIPLSPQVKELLGVAEDALSGQALIRAILQLPVDLLWNGGIGTYVKASSERHADVSDAANDGVRIDASQLKARVVGEGGNLGFTQLARIQYCLAGGRMNTDAIDNSAGVDMSDHEVNIKILLQPMLKSGRLSLRRRNQLLREMTDEVSRLVLRDNYGQSLCLSLAERASRKDLHLFRSLLDYLVESENLKPDVEYLPGPKTLQERSRNGQGLTRPELAILLAYTKMGLTRHLLQTDLLDEPHLQHHLRDYFPRPLREKYQERMKDHRLRREIIACQLTNLVVDRLGIPFVHGAIRDTGASPSEVSKAALAALEALELNSLWERLFNLDNKIPADAQYRALEEIVKAVEGIVQWILLADVDIENLSEFVAVYRDPLKRLRACLEPFLPIAEAKRFQMNRDKIVNAGFPEDLATELTSMEYLTSAMGVIDVSRKTKASLAEAARHFYAIGDRLALGWLRDGIHELSQKSKWEKIACGGLVMDLRNVQRQLTIDFVDAQAARETPLNAFLARRPRLLKRFDDALWQVKTTAGLDLTTGTVLTRLLVQMTGQA